MKTDFGKIINQAFAITFRNKWLWVFGLVLAVTTSSGGGGGGGSSNRSSSVDKKVNTQIDNYQAPSSTPPNLQNLAPQLLNNGQRVLGEATLSVKEVLSHVPVSYYFFFAFAVLLAGALSVAIVIYAKSWATGSLINGIDLESTKTFVSLSASSAKGRGTAIELVKITLIPSFILMVILAIPSFLVLILAGLMPSLGVILAIPLIFVAAIILIFVSVIIALGKFAIVLEGLGWKSAFRRGFFVLKTNFLDIFVMGIINCFIGSLASIASCLVLLPLLALGIASFASVTVFPPILVAALPIGALVLVLVIMAFTLLRAVLIVFSHATWVLLYKELTGLKVDNGSN